MFRVAEWGVVEIVTVVFKVVVVVVVVVVVGVVVVVVITVVVVVVTVVVVVDSVVVVVGTIVIVWEYTVVVTNNTKSINIFIFVTVVFLQKYFLSTKIQIIFEKQFTFILIEHFLLDLFSYNGIKWITIATINFFNKMLIV